MLTLQKVSIGYGETPVVHEVSFHVEAGDRLALMGPNGCGKTTLLRAIAGVLPYAGEILISGRPLDRMKRKELAAKVAMLSQNSGVYLGYSIYDTVMMGRYVHAKGLLAGLPSEEDRAVVLHCLEAVDLLTLRERPITELSGGQLQRVFLARALAQEPEIILLDEPTNHLDLRYQLELMEYLQSWSAEGERAVIGALHDVNLGMHFCDKALVMREGRIQAFGKAQEVLTSGLLTETYGAPVVEYMRRSLGIWVEME